jgi:hypothetical protein
MKILTAILAALLGSASGVLAKAPLSRLSLSRRRANRSRVRRSISFVAVYPTNSPPAHTVIEFRTAVQAVIPGPIDQNRCAHWRNPMDMMRQG